MEDLTLELEKTKELEKCYVHNIFITLLQQIICGKVLWVEKKSNLSGEFKLKPIITYQI